MTHPDFQRVKAIFLDACIKSPEERQDVLDRSCGSDAALRAEVESLLTYDRELPSFLAAVPERIGPYRVLDCIGRGGMAVVYRAEQDHPRRAVALKVLSPGVLTRDRLRRFEFDTQVLGQLQHPGIAQIIEAGWTEVQGQYLPFFAMELIEGRPLTEYAETHRLEARQRLALLADICDAVHYAHQKGVIHRDLKPANILVAPSGQPKILDFGVARATDADLAVTTLHTDVGELIGTIPYMSPEQVAADPHELDIRSDVYSLGVIAYELLSGKLPYPVRQKSLAEAIRTIREAEPVPLSSVGKLFRGDLETIICKTLEKDKNRRYPSASEFAADIRHYLRDEPLVARPASAAYRFRKFARRNKTLVGGVAGVLLALLAGFAGTLWQAVQAAHQRDLAVAAQRVAEQRQAETERATRKTQRVQDFLQSMLASVDPDAARGRDTGVLRDMLDEASRRVEADLNDQPEVEAEVRFTIGNAYYTIGRWNEALAHLRRVVDLRRQLLGPEHPDLATSLNQLGRVLTAVDDYAEAEGAYHQALAIRRTAFGEEHLEVAASLNDLGEILVRKGRDLEADHSSRTSCLTEAERCLEQALTIRRKLLGGLHRDVAQSLKNLAFLFQLKDDLAAAEERYAEALSIMRDLFGDEHRDVATLQYQMAALLRDQGKYAEAEALFRQTLATYRKLLGSAHPHVASCLMSLGKTHYAHGDYAAAEPSFREALTIFRDSLGEDHPNTTDMASYLGLTLEFQGKYEEALPLAREALAAYRKTFGEDHPYVARATGNVARLLIRLDQPDEAEPLLHATLARVQKSLGDEHPDVATTLDLLGQLMWQRDDLQEAARLYEQALAIRRKVLGDEHPRVATSLNHLAIALQNQGDLPEAEAALREALGIQQKVLPPAHPDLADTLINLGCALLEQSRAAEAEPLLREGLDLRLQTLREEHGAVGYARNLLGACLAAQGQFDEAEPLLLGGGYEAMKNAPQTTEKRQHAVLERIARLYESWGRPEQATEWRAQLPTTQTAPHKRQVPAP